MLTSKQRAYLRKLGHPTEPVLQIGKGGVTDPVVQQLDEALEARELVKAKVLQNCTDSLERVADQLASATGADVVQMIGSTILLYRRSADDPTIELP